MPGLDPNIHILGRMLLSPPPHRRAHVFHDPPAPHERILRGPNNERQGFKMSAWLRTLTLTTFFMLGPLCAFNVPPSAPFRRRRYHPSPSHLQQQQHRQQQHPCSASRPPPRYSSSTATNSDAAQEEEPWPAELNVEPLFRPCPNRQRCATPTSEQEAVAPGKILRGMAVGDVDGVVSLAFTEYYEGPMEFSAGVTEGLDVLVKSAWERTLANGKFKEEDVGQLTDWLEMVWLRVMIRWGFIMRIFIGEYGRDHKVFCVVDEERGDGDSSLVAVAEVSLQVPNGRTASPFPCPLWVKRARQSQSVCGSEPASSTLPKAQAWPGPVLPYISNVLVHPSLRRKGLANRLMRRCEEQARAWGYNQVYLHVDLTYYPAVRMYERMGYEVVNDLEVLFETPRLRYMKKIL